MQVDTILRSKGGGVETIEAAATVEGAVRHMRLKRVGALVVSADGQRLDGIITERDVLLGLDRHGAALLHMTVGQIMNRSVLTCAPTDAVTQVMSDMTHRRVRHLPVVDHGRLVGLVSIGDVVKSRLEEVEAAANVMRDAYLARH